MGPDSTSGTSPTLLGRLRLPDDPGAWDEFVHRYGPRIYRWCRQWRLQDADSQDVAQEVLLRLARRLRTFEYDPARSFRAWLRTVAQHAWSDFVSARQRPDLGTGDSGVLSALHAVEARDDLVARLEEEFDHELLAEASARVRLRVEPQTWEAYHLVTAGGLSSEQAARQLGIRITSVYKAKNRVLETLRDELARLEQGR